MHCKCRDGCLCDCRAACVTLALYLCFLSSARRDHLLTVSTITQSTAFKIRQQDKCKQQVVEGFSNYTVLGLRQDVPEAQLLFSIRWWCPPLGPYTESAQHSLIQRLLTQDWLDLDVSFRFWRRLLCSKSCPEAIHERSRTRLVTQ